MKNRRNYQPSSRVVLFPCLSLAVLLAACGGGGGNPLPINTAPNAAFTLSTITGNAPLAVSFDASASSDAEGTVVSADWDFNADGFSDASGAQVSFNFAQAGSFVVRLTVRDNGGLSDSAEQQVDVSAPAFQHVTIAPASSNLALIAAAIVDGRPAACFAELAAGGLNYTRAADSTGSAWGAPVNVDSEIVSAAGLAVVAGNPAILFRRQSDSVLRYVRAADAQGSSWPASVVVSDSALVDGAELKLLIADGKPLVLVGKSLDFATTEIFAGRADDATGSTWSLDGTPITELNDTAGSFASAIIGGRPALALAERGGGADVQFFRALDSAGSQWPTEGAIVGDNFDSFSRAFYLEEAGGRPMLVMTATPSGSANPVTTVLQAQDSGGASWLPNANVPGLSDDDFVLDFGVIAGFAVIALDGSGANEIRLLLSSDSLGSSFIQQLVADPQDGFPALLLEVNQRPAIAYVAETGDEFGWAFGQ